ncbi:endoglucanase [uncultured Methanobrevibacter sp.]|uniref:endoglucanase n=1 Tax=uncultured Methanobrevibacter sp. TaxID=253161 RepID=UPI0025FC1820|nr:endoglucanase [uncultured Methanobrevibacter sp.]
MEKSNIIISVIIVLCIAAGVTAYGVTSENNGIFKTLQGIGSDSSNDGSGTGNVSVNTSDSSSSGDEGTEGTSDGGYSEDSGSGESDSGGSSDSGDGGDGGDGGGSEADPTVATYTVTTQNADGGYTITYYNAYDQSIGFIRYDADGNQIEGGGGAPGG